MPRHLYKNIKTGEEIEFTGRVIEYGVEKLAFQWLKSNAFSGTFNVFVSGWNRFSMFWQKI